MKKKVFCKVWICMGMLLLFLGGILKGETVRAEGENVNEERSYIYFGSYPQSEVTDAEVIDAIDSAINEKYEELGANALFGDVGIDIEVDGVMYRRITKSNIEMDGNYGENRARYFKWEPIKWRVLEDNGDTLVVMASKALECKRYHEEDENVTWENCTLRTWLNSVFYKIAFTESEQEAIVTQTVKNDDNSEYGTEGGNDTQDKVYLLSGDDVIKSNYGFREDWLVESSTRWVGVSTYAYARGVLADCDSEGTGGNTTCFWWLRSPGMYSYDAAYVTAYGMVATYGFSVHTHMAVLPVMQIDASSKLWTEADSEGEIKSWEKAATPSASAPSGSELEAKSKVYLSCETPNAEIRYTLNGQRPTDYSLLYTDGITISENATLKAVAMCDGYEVSEIASFDYTVKKVSEENQGVGNSNGSVIEGNGNGGNNATGSTIEGSDGGNNSGTNSSGVTENADNSSGGSSEGSASDEATNTESTKVLAVGTSISDVNSVAVYKVTKASAKIKTVEYVKPKNKKVTQAVIPETIVSNGITYKVTAISKKAFYSCKKLKTVKIGKNVTSIGNQAFYKCIALKKITISNNVTTIGEKAFYKCTALKAITIPSKVKKIGKQAFYGCKNLKSITIKTTKLTKNTVGSSAFQNIYKKAVIKVPKKKCTYYQKVLKTKGVGEKVKVKG